MELTFGPASSLTGHSVDRPPQQCRIRIPSPSPNDLAEYTEARAVINEGIVKEGAVD